MKYPYLKLEASLAKKIKKLRKLFNYPSRLKLIEDIFMELEKNKFENFIIYKGKKPFNLYRLSWEEYFTLLYLKSKLPPEYNHINLSTFINSLYAYFVWKYQKLFKGGE